MTGSKLQTIFTLLCCIGCVCSAHAQNGKKVITALEAATRTSGSNLLKEGVSAAGKNVLDRVGVSAAQKTAGVAGKQLGIQFPGEPVQLEIPFASLDARASSQLNTALSDQIHKQINLERSRDEVLTLPSGETARIVNLEARHFKKTNQAAATFRYFLNSGSKPVTLISKKTGKKIMVLKNDRLRYFTDLNQACPAGSFLIRNEEGVVSFLTFQQAGPSFMNAYEQAYAHSYNPEFTPLSFEEVESNYKMPQVKELSSLFGATSAVSRVYNMEKHPLNEEPVQVAVLTKTIQVEGLPLLQYGSMIVRYKSGLYEVHPADLVPPVLAEKIDNASAVKANDDPFIKKEVQPVTPKTYESQTDLACDLHRLLQGKGQAYTSFFLGDFIAYEIPQGIYYKPAGRAGAFLNPEKQVAIYFPESDRGQIVDRALLNDPQMASPVK